MDKKIIFSGSYGCGRSCSIRSISDRMIVIADDCTIDHHALIKPTSAIGMDYGILNISGNDRIHLYGIPGGIEFRQILDTMCEDALGFVILLDCKHPDPVADLELYLNAMKKYIAASGNTVVIGVTQTDPNTTDLDIFRIKLASMGLSIPVLELDCQYSDDIKQTLLSLIAMRELALMQV